jgi:hypothetical protein
LWRDSAHARRVRRAYDDVFEIPEQTRYDRILSIAVLEHLTELPWIVARSALHLNAGGQFVAGFPSEGKLLWSLSWRLTTGVGYWLRTRLNYARLMQYEHVNQSDDIIAVARHFFEDVSTWSWPTPIPHLSFYRVIRASGPKLDAARAFLGSRPYEPSRPPHEC